MCIFLASYLIAVRQADGGEERLFMDAWLSWDSSQPGGLREHGREYFDMLNHRVDPPVASSVLWCAQV